MFDPLLNWLTDFVFWIWGILIGLFELIRQFLTDLAIGLLDLVLTAVAGLIAAIPVPAFISGGLSGLWNQLPASVGFFIDALNMPFALGMIGAGYGFRLLRKLLTLGQW